MDADTRLAEIAKKAQLLAKAYTEWLNRISPLYSDQQLADEVETFLQEVPCWLLTEVDRLRKRLAELEGAAKCPSVAPAYGSRCALPVRHHGDHRNAARNHYWDDTHAAPVDPGVLA